MPNRSYTAGSQFRYGFNGKENDNDVKGTGNQQDYGMRIYDPRIGKFLSVDPLTIEYPWNTPFSYAENEPISNVDLDGLEQKKSTSSISLICKGIKKGVKESSSSVKTMVSSQTYKSAFQNVKSFTILALKNPNYAVRAFSAGALNFSLGISKSIQSVTTEPVIWTLGIPNRTKEENLIGIGYGTWRITEFYLLFRFPEAFEDNLPKVKVDLMGGPTSRYGKGWINFDLANVSKTGITTNVESFGKYFPNGSVAEIICDNPRADFIKYVKDQIKEGGTIIVRGTKSNSYFNKIYNGKAEGLEDFEIIETNPNYSNEGHKTTDGDPIKGQMIELKLTKKTNSKTR